MGLLFEPPCRTLS